MEIQSGVWRQSMKGRTCSSLHAIARNAAFSYHGIWLRN